MVQAFGLEDRVLFSSFHAQSLLRLKEIAPAAPCGLLNKDKLPHAGRVIRDFGFEAYHPLYLRLRPSVIRDLKEHGIQINTYTVNGHGSLTYLLAWDVHSVITNYPERAIAFMDYMMSEHGQMLIYLGVEGVTYDIVDGKPVLKEDVSKILNSDRETYDRLYGADDAYWMLQNNVMQLQWEQKAGPATEQLLVWACKYTVYNGQYDVSLSTSPEIAAMDEKCTKLWSETLPKLLLASNEAQFDEIFEEFVGKRNAMGYQEVLKQKTVLMNAAKEKMGISE